MKCEVVNHNGEKWEFPSVDEAKRHIRTCRLWVEIEDIYGVRRRICYGSVNPETAGAPSGKREEEDEEEEDCYEKI